MPQDVVAIECTKRHLGRAARSADPTAVVVVVVVVADEASLPVVAESLGCRVHLLRQSHRHQ